jgi:Ca2+-binding RTX toxin-like protein
MRRTMLLLATMALTLLVASGVALAVTKIGGPGPDRLGGTDGDDNLLGKGGNDKLYALRGRDNLLGGSGKDLVLGGGRRAMGGDKNLVGGSGDDVVGGGLGVDNVVGGEGDDVLTGGPDRKTDTLSAGDGNDVVGVQDPQAVKDLVTCGSGFDQVYVDSKDVVARDCEVVHR